MKLLQIGAKTAEPVYVQLDDADFESASFFRWSRVKQRHTWYAVRTLTVNGKRIGVYLHTYLTGWTRIDHIDHNGLNNQRSNLRPVTNLQNSMNRRANFQRIFSVQGC